MWSKQYQNSSLFKHAYSCNINLPRIETKIFKKKKIYLSIPRTLENLNKKEYL